MGMGVAEWTAVFLAVLTIVASVIGSLLRGKDRQQEKQLADQSSAIVNLTEKIAAQEGSIKQLIDLVKQQSDLIKDLYEKHEADDLRLTTLQIEIAKMYAPKQEIKEMIEDVKKHFDDQFTRFLNVQMSDRNRRRTMDEAPQS